MDKKYTFLLFKNLLIKFLLNFYKDEYQEEESKRALQKFFTGG